MNERLNLQDLVDILAKQQDITKKDAETFLRELFVVISENIEKNDSVRIKNFGTFKLVKVNARKSVDVNTGEDIEIAAHYKLSFTPEKSLKDAINRPFAHFESVVLEEGVTFDNVRDEDIAEDNDNSNASIENNITDINDPVSETEDIDVEAVLLADETIIEEPQVITIDIPNESPRPEEQVERPSDDTKEECSEEVTATDNSFPSSNSNSEPNDSTKTESEEMFEKHKRRTKRRRFISQFFITTLIIAAFAVGGYYFQEIMTAATEATQEANQNQKEQSIPDKEQITGNTISEQLADSTTTTGKTEAVSAIEEQKIPSKTNNEPLAIETLEYGQTMRLISLKHYGHKSFWPYIYEENKAIMKNPNNVPIGSKIIIPQPAKYGIDANSKESIAKAKALETKLVNDLGL